MRRVLVVFLLAGCVLTAQQPAPYFTDVFPPEEFAARRARVMEQIGDAVAVLQGAPEMSAECPSAEQPVLLPDRASSAARDPDDRRAGRSSSTLYLAAATTARALQRARARARRRGRPHHGHRRRSLARETIRGAPSRSLAQEVACAVHAAPRRKSSAEAPAGEATGTRARRTRIRGTAGPSRERAVHRRSCRRPQCRRRCRSKDLDPIVDALRVIKSPREIAVIREATRITGLGIMEAMRDARPGKREYELQAAAEFVFKQCTTRRARLLSRCRDRAQHRLLALPPWHRARCRTAISCSSTTRPTTSTTVGRDAASFRPTAVHAAAARVLHDLPAPLPGADDVDQARCHHRRRTSLKRRGGKMDTIMAAFRFTDPKIKDAATAFAAQYQPRASRAPASGTALGMEVHDVTVRRAVASSRAMLFTIEPAISIP